MCNEFHALIFIRISYEVDTYSFSKVFLKFVFNRLIDRLMAFIFVLLMVITLNIKFIINYYLLKILESYILYKFMDN